MLKTGVNRRTEREQERRQREGREREREIGRVREGIEGTRKRGKTEREGDWRRR